MIIRKEIFLDFFNHKIVGDVIGSSPVKSIFLHGAGKATAKSFDDLRKMFLRQLLILLDMEKPAEICENQA
jgi:hypothetical protein